jgi:hypothetical protein
MPLLCISISSVSMVRISSATRSCTCFVQRNPQPEYISTT